MSPEVKERTANEQIVKELLSNKEFVSSVKRGIAECKAGKIISWADAKKELGIK